MSNPCLVDKDGNQVILKEGLVFWHRFDVPYFVLVYDEKDPVNPLLWQENGKTSERKAFLSLQNCYAFCELIGIIAQASGFKTKVIEMSNARQAIRICR